MFSYRYDFRRKGEWLVLSIKGIWSSIEDCPPSPIFICWSFQWYPDMKLPTLVDLPARPQAPSFRTFSVSFHLWFPSLEQFFHTEHNSGAFRWLCPGWPAETKCFTEKVRMRSKWKSSKSDFKTILRFWQINKQNSSKGRFIVGKFYQLQQ